MKPPLTHGSHRDPRRPRWSVLGVTLVAALALPWTLVSVPGMFAAAAAPAPASLAARVVDDGLSGLLLRPATLSRLPERKRARLTGRLAAAGRPLRITIPALAVNSPVVPISGDSGELLPPSDPTTIGWWEQGRVPGAAAGGAVLTGHTVHTGGGAFDHLDTLARGDVVQVRTTAGTIRYVVRTVIAYKSARLAADAASIFRRSGPSRLVLITCTQFNGVEYLANTVVYAVPMR